MTASRTVDIDLRRDLVETYRAELDRLGYDAHHVSGDAELLRAYFGVCRRLVIPQPRQTLKSKSFSCSPKYHDALAQIEQIVREGGDLTPYLSKKIRDLEYNDDLLNDWGIHHLHLGTSVELDGFVSRTGPLLHCRFEDDIAYFIDVLPHGSWTLQRLITIMHENWPEFLSQFRIHGATGDGLTDEQVKVLRGKRLNYFLKMNDGTVYGAMGEGYSTAGTNVMDLARSDYLLSWAEDRQREIIDNIEEIAENARKQGVELPFSLHFKMQVIEGQFFAVENDSNVGVDLKRSA